MSETESAQESLDEASRSASQADSSHIPAAHTFMLVATQTLGLIKSSIDLLGLELMLALKAVPKLIALSVGLVFFLSLAWISFSVCMSWVAFHFTGEIGAAIFGFLFVQLTAVAVVLFSMKCTKRALTLPHSRAQAKEIVEVLNEAFRAGETKANRGGPEGRPAQ